MAPTIALETVLDVLDNTLLFSCFFTTFLPLLLLLTMVASSLALLVALASLSSAAPVLEERAANVLPDFIANNLGPYSPYHANGVYQAVPSGCSLTQVNILQRHGQRFPTANAGKKIKASVAKLQKATSFSSDLSFVTDYVYELGADDLTPSGASELYREGQEAYKRYSKLFPPFVRTDSSQRVVDSAGNWTEAVYARKGKRTWPLPAVIDNTAGSNDTLDDNNCDSAPDLSSYETTWLATYAAVATARLNSAAPGANLTTADTLNFQQLCGFDSEYHGVLSQWCGLFTKEEWEGMEYYYDLDKYYGTGYGQPLGRVQGVGYVNELLSRLTANRRYVGADQTQVNHTLDSSPSTFPLSGYSWFTDFSHDNEITAILAALGLKEDATPLAASGPQEGQTWVTSEIVPFGGKLVTERVQCGVEKYVRFFINEQLQIPTFCAGFSSTTGLCTVENFVESQSYARNNGEGDWAKVRARP
ncbi:hypothetical protein JCM8547_008381 [Rhodosporidiobolus lusitaniae]